MATLTLLPKREWFKPNIETVTKNSFTIINILDQYTPENNETVTDSWDASEDGDGSIMVYAEGTTLNISGNGSGKIYMNSVSGNAFDYFEKVTTINGANLLDFSNVTSMTGMLQRSYVLTSIDMSSWNVSNVKSMKGVFNQCYALTSIDLSQWNTGSATDMTGMFLSCRELTSIGDLSNWNTSNVTNMYTMFSNCKKLTTVNGITNWNTGNVTDMGGMFSVCHSLSTIDLSGWDTSSLTSAYGMFEECSELTSVGNISQWNVSKLNSTRNMFSKCKKLSSIDLSGWNTTSLNNMNFMFNECELLTSVNLSGWDVSNVTTMQAMFQRCYALSSINTSNWNWDNAKVYDMSYVFALCHALSSIDLSNWNTSNVTTMYCMFNQCYPLTSVDGISNWNTSKLEHTTGMFLECTGLTSVDVSNWDTSSLINIDYMFAGCTSLTSIDVFNINTEKILRVDSVFKDTKCSVYDVSKWNTSSCNTFANMFLNCENVEEIIGLDKLDTSNGKKFGGMFQGCSKLTSLDLSHFDMRSMDDSYSVSGSGEGDNATLDMLKDLTSLEVLKLGENCNLRDNSGLPNPSTGYWYSETSAIRYSAENIPNGVSDTYLANSPEVLVKSSILYEIADAIREGTGKGDTMKVSLMPSNIRNDLNSVMDGLITGSITTFTFPSKPTVINSQLFSGCDNLTEINCPWAPDEVEGEPWGAPDTATVYYGQEPEFQSNS